MRTELASYLETALWSSTICSDDDKDGDSYDDWYSVNDFAPEAIEQADKELADFELEAESLLSDDDRSQNVGHDFWLTRNGHGAGFWDGDYENGDALTELCRPYGSCNIYIGDGNQLYFQ